MDFILAQQSWPFTGAALLLLSITIIEGLGLLAGMSLSGWLDNLIPEIDPGLDADADGFLDSWLGWLHLGQVPVLVLLVIILASFSLIGYLINALSVSILGFYPPVILSSMLAFLASLPVAKGCGTAIARIIPRDETTAESLEKLVGKIAVVVNGTAKQNYPAQARVKNSFGQTIYIHVEPDSPEAELNTGESVLLVRQISGSRFIAILNPRPDIL